MTPDYEGNERRHDPPATPKQRRQRLVSGAGGGTASGVSIAILVGFAWQRIMHEPLPWEVAISVGAVIGSLSSTVAICLRDNRELLRAWIERHRHRGGRS